MAERTRKAWLVSVKGHPGEPVYAPNASKARAKVITDLRDAWGCTFREALSEVGRVTRLPHLDLTLPPRRPLAETLSTELLHCVVHAYGGRGVNAGCRDHFYTDAGDPIMKAGLYHCLFRVCRRDKGWGGQTDMIMYGLTALGKNVARGEVKTYPECWP